VAHGVTSLYHGFLKYLGEEEVRRRIAAIQLSGRAEDYLVKEFVAFVHDATDGRRFVYTNYPNCSEASLDFVSWSWTECHFNSINDLKFQNPRQPPFQKTPYQHRGRVLRSSSGLLH